MKDEEASQTARQALDLARDVEHRIDSHEDICAFRYAQLDSSIKAVRDEVSASVGDIKKVIGWAGSLAFVIIIGALGFFLKAQFDSYQKMEDTIEALQTQRHDEQHH